MGLRTTLFPNQVEHGSFAEKLGLAFSQLGIAMFRHNQYYLAVSPDRKQMWRWVGRRAESQEQCRYERLDPISGGTRLRARSAPPGDVRWGRDWNRDLPARWPDSGSESRAQQNAWLQPAGTGRHARWRFLSGSSSGTSSRNWPRNLSRQFFARRTIAGRADAGRARLDRNRKALPAKRRFRSLGTSDGVARARRATAARLPDRDAGGRDRAQAGGRTSARSREDGSHRKAGGRNRPRLQ